MASGLARNKNHRFSHWEMRLIPNEGCSVLIWRMWSLTTAGNFGPVGPVGRSAKPASPNFRYRLVQRKTVSGVTPNSWETKAKLNPSSKRSLTARNLKSVG
jgi:hypothetical protein